MADRLEDLVQLQTMGQPKTLDARRGLLLALRRWKPKKDDDIENLLASMKGMPGGGGLTMMRPGDMDLGDDKVDEIDVLKDEV